MQHARRTQRGFFAIGLALALVAGFAVGGVGLVELSEDGSQAVAVEAPPAIAAQAGGEAGAY